MKKIISPVSYILIMFIIITISLFIIFYSNDNIEFSLNSGAKERGSPYDRINLKDIVVKDGFIKIKLDNIRIVRVADTNSMDPVIDDSSEVIEIIPKSEIELKIGDIISYYSKEFNTMIIHRIIDIGEDDEGWYAICKGDNNKVKDPEKIRFWQIRGVVVGILY